MLVRRSLLFSSTTTTSSSSSSSSCMSWSSVASSLLRRSRTSPLLSSSSSSSPSSSPSTSSSSQMLSLSSMTSVMPTRSLSLLCRASNVHRARGGGNSAAVAAVAAAACPPDALPPRRTSSSSSSSTPPPSSSSSSSSSASAHGDATTATATATTVTSASSSFFSTLLRRLALLFAAALGVSLAAQAYEHQTVFVSEMEQRSMLFQLRDDAFDELQRTPEARRLRTMPAVTLSSIRHLSGSIDEQLGKVQLQSFDDGTFYACVKPWHTTVVVSFIFDVIVSDPTVDRRATPWAQAAGIPRASIAVEAEWNRGALRASKIQMFTFHDDAELRPVTVVKRDKRVHRSIDFALATVASREIDEQRMNKLINRASAAY